MTLRHCQSCGRAFTARAMWCPSCYDDRGQLRPPVPVVAFPSYPAGLNVRTKNNPTCFTGGVVLPPGTRGVTVSETDWRMGSTMTLLEGAPYACLMHHTRIEQERA